MATSTYLYDEHADKGPELIATILVLFFVATVPVVLRIFTRLSTSPRTCGIDDTLLVGAWVCEHPTIFYEMSINGIE